MKKKPEPDPDENPDPDDLWSLAASRAARDEGMARVLTGQEWFRANYYRLMKDRATQREMPLPFKGEDFKAYALPLIGKPHHHNCWSAMFGAAVKTGLVQFLGQHTQCELESSHACDAKLYVWPGVEVDFTFSDE